MAISRCGASSHCWKLGLQQVKLQGGLMMLDAWPNVEHVSAARQRAGELLSKRTQERLDEAMRDGGITCLVAFSESLAEQFTEFWLDRFSAEIDGPNIGYRGAVQRRSMSEGSRKGE
eukprot:Skav217176  [mRNA]  locus=scaffold5232:26147:28654:+ [translate_table: standard]